jgi:ssDNA-specific exonuclease RecJ
MPNQPRDLTADKEAFLAAIDPISIQEIPTVFDAEVLEKLPASLDETKGTINHLLYSTPMIICKHTLQSPRFSLTRFVYK